MTAPTPNAELAYRVLDHIDAHPKNWDQHHWCGTAKCFAGWAVELSGETPDHNQEIGGVHVSQRAAELLGFESEFDMGQFAEAKYEERGGEFDVDGYATEDLDLFSAVLTREDLDRVVAEIFGPRPHPAESSFAPNATLKDSPDPMYPEAEDDVPPNAGSAS